MPSTRALLLVALPGALAAQEPARPAFRDPRSSAMAAVPSDSVARAAAPAAADAPAPAEARKRAQPPRPGMPPGATVTAELRSRSEFEREGDGTENAATLLRSRLALRLPLGEGVRAALGIQGHQMLDRDASAPATAGALDVYEGYVEVAHAVRGAPVAVRGGRHVLGVGNERLIGGRGWSNAKHSFDGVRVAAGPGGATPSVSGTGPASVKGWGLSGFAVTPAVHTRPAGAPLPTIYGLDFLRPVGGLPGAVAELTAIHERGGRTRGVEVDGRTTLAGRVRAPRLRHLGAELEAAVQTGTQHALVATGAPAAPDQTIAAWMAAGRIGLPAVPGRRVQAALGLDLLSGDAPDSPTRHGAFDTIQGSNHAFYGAGDVAGGNPAATLRGRGLADAFVTTTVAAGPRASVRTDLHRMRPMRGAGLFGYEADVIAPIKLVANTRLEVGYTAFRTGPAGAAVGLGERGRVRGWGYVQLTATR